MATCQEYVGDTHDYPMTNFVKFYILITVFKNPFTVIF